MSSLWLPSYAKINLGLFVRGKRRDGYHEIETILHQISLKDEITLSSRNSPEISLRCDDKSLPSGPENLCIKAAHALRKASSHTPGAEIYLKKKIPVGAGLGGGSSNAAAVLLGLNVLWNLGLGRQELGEIAATLGSDVPFFINGGTALATGRGEKLFPMNLALQNEVILIVFPNVHISTREAYSSLNLDLTINKKNLTLSSFKGRDFQKAGFFDFIRNDFEENAFLNYPQLGEIRSLLSDTAEYVGLSGSGSAMFAVYSSEEQAHQAISPELGHCKTFITRSVVWGYSQLSRSRQP